MTTLCLLLLALSHIYKTQQRGRVQHRVRLPSREMLLCPTSSALPSLRGVGSGYDRTSLRAGSAHALAAHAFDRDVVNLAYFV